MRMREHERFRVDPKYTAVTVRRLNDRVLQVLEGHVYDVSECAARIELDESLSVGEEVALSITLPMETRAIGVTGQVIWSHDDLDDPGPRRIGVRFDAFADPADRGRLLRGAGAAPCRRAA